MHYCLEYTIETLTQARTTRTRSLPVPAGTARVRKSTVYLTRPKYDGLRMSLPEFRQWERESDGWKYEWSNGVIEINEVSMKNTERFIAQNISRAFTQTQAYKERGELFSETDCEFASGQVRCPDLACFAAEQIQVGRLQGQPVPLFVIEIVSKHDKIKAMHDKLDEYFANGVQCVWYIFPDKQRVDLYIAPLNIQICVGETPCSAAPALDFSIKAADIFA